MDDVTRRTYLRAGIATVGTVGLGALAGCSSAEADDPAGGGGTGSDGGDGSSGDDGSGTTDPSGEPSGGDDDVPVATFEYEYVASDGTLTITYTGGDDVAVARFRVEGEHLGSGNTGYWLDLPGAEASMTVAGTQSLGLMDDVTLGGSEGQDSVPDDYTVELVFETDGGGEAVISSDRGPGA